MNLKYCAGLDVASKKIDVCLSVIDHAQSVKVVSSKSFPNTLNGFKDQAVRLLTVTLIGWKLAPAGTVTTSEVSVAACTTALTAPKYTRLSLKTELKFRPLIVTEVPNLPLSGKKDAIEGRL